MHFYEGHFGGMHLIWWIIWIILLAWIFFIPADIPYQKQRRTAHWIFLKTALQKAKYPRKNLRNQKRY